MGEKEAGKLLKELEEKGDVRDPTKWLIAAAMRKTGGGGGGSWGGSQGGTWVQIGSGGGRGGGFDMSGGGDGKKISKTIGWINKNHAESLAEPIQFNEVYGPLSMLGDTEACKLLKELEENVSTIKNPTKWLMAAAMRRTGGGKGGGSKGAVVPMWGAPAWGGGAVVPWSGAGGGVDGKKISKTIGWINKTYGEQMAEPIQFNEVQAPLMLIGDREACKLLKELEEKVGEIKNPTNWIKAAAMRRVQM